jgi:4'-phosphopantetheinyl transferase
MQVHALPTPVLARWHAMLDAREQAQAARFHAAHDRSTYIAAHALTRLLLAEIGARAPADWRITENDSGKPEVDGLHFSLSHTNGFVACTVSSNAQVGIDTEARDRRQKHADLAATVLAPSEYLFLRSLPEERHAECFLRFWTLREAYVKATGQGISFPREDFSVTLDPLSIRLSDGTGAGRWQFFSWDEDRHIVSLAVNSDVPMTLVKRHFSESDLP